MMKYVITIVAVLLIFPIEAFGFFGSKIGLGGKDVRIPLQWLEDPVKKEAGFVYGPGDYGRKLDFKGEERFYEMHVPSQYTTGKPAAVVLNLHGGGGNPSGARYATGMDSVADQHGFIVVYPAGSGKLFSDRLLVWNDGRPDRHGKPYTADDVGFISALLDDLATLFHVDPQRVYVCGISNGAQMSYRLAKQLSDRIAAIAVVAGHRSVEDEWLPPPKKPISVMQFSGIQDKFAPYDGGAPPKKAGLITVDFEFKMKPVKEVIKSWTIFNGCPSDPSETKKVGKAVMNRYGACKNGTEVVLWTLEDAGHTWPGGQVFPAEIKAGVGNVNQDISASELIWEFFKKHTLNND